MLSVADYFGAATPQVATAPGRVNLLGEHTDYNDGFVLPSALPGHVTVALAHSTDGDWHLYSATLDQHIHFDRRRAVPAGFARYVMGCVAMAEQGGAQIPPLRVYLDSTLPMGAGLSSSAALEVATLRALRALFELPFDDVTVALLAQQAEIRYAEVNCGVMDQMASSLAPVGQMLFLDTRTLARRVLPLPAGAELIVIDSGVARRLAASKYNERRAECSQAAQLLDVAALRDVTDVAATADLPAPLRQRARHVVTENLRVLEAADGISATRFGALMNASHDSLRDDYQVSIAELDRLAEALQRHPRVYGARLTGAGFGGACVALCHTGSAAEVAQSVVIEMRTGGIAARALLPELAGMPVA